MTPFLTEPLDSLPSYPFLTLLVSGGHTQIVLVESPQQFEILATTNDEPIGRTYDKVARLLGIPWGERGLGASLEEYVRNGPPEEYNEDEGYEIPIFGLPAPGRLEFAFATYHSSTALFVRAREGSIDECTRYAVASSFQKAAMHQLGMKLKLAIRLCKSRYISIRHLVVSGGVASNAFLRER